VRCEQAARNTSGAEECDLPDAVDTDPVCELHLFERFVVEPPLSVIIPVGACGTRQLVLVEDTEIHRGDSRIVA